MALHNRRDRNREAIERFARCFEPKLEYAQTQAIGGRAVTNGWTATYYDPDTELGVTAVAFGAGQFKCWVEAFGTDADADFLGAMMAGITEMVKAQPEDVDEDQRQAEDAQLISDRMRRERAFIQEPPRDAEGRPLRRMTREEIEGQHTASEWPKDAPWPEGKSLIPTPPVPGPHAKSEHPNPRLVDMTDLDAKERHALVMQWPQLAFLITPEGRASVDALGNQTLWDGAGFCTEEQLKYVRMWSTQEPLLRPRPGTGAGQGRLAPRIRSGISQGPTSPSPASEPQVVAQPMTAMGARPKANCDHLWVRNSIGGGSTCSKCGGFEPSNGVRERTAARNAQDKLEMLQAREARCAEKGHDFVQLRGEQIRTCVHCGLTEQTPSADVGEGTE